jgi:hypothetical protein
MMDQTQYGLDAQLTQSPKPLVCPRPIRLLQASRRDLLPEDGIADGANAEGRKSVKVVEAQGVTIEC